jgi:uncharacterized protein involved in exopolysaccharide biosynthesis
MLQSYAAPHQALYEERPTDAGLAHYLSIVKRRLFYFLVPFVLVLAVGSAIVAIQVPIYLAEGKILVESQDIPVDLVRPTVTDTANQRIQVIQQRIMTRDNLSTIINKYGLFPSERKWMSSTQLLDLMRERIKLELLDLSRPTQQNNLTIALKLSFEYEDPQAAMRVANEFLTLILSEDARTRTNRAAETTKFLAREAKRLEGELGAIDAQLVELRRRPRPLSASEQLNQELTKFKSQLLEKSSTYSASHPEVRALKRKVAALEQVLSKTPQTATQTAETPQTATQTAEPGLPELVKQRTALENSLEEANRKLTAARLGESLERDQQSERLQVIEQPTLPQKPVKPNRPKLFALAFALAGMAGAGVVFLAENFDQTIRSARQLGGIIDRKLIVTIPYIITAAETRRKRRKRMLILLSVIGTVLIAVSVALYLGFDASKLLDRDWTETIRVWRDYLTRLSK